MSNDITPFCNLAIERGVIACLLLHGKAVYDMLSPVLEAGDFQQPAHQVVFEASGTLHEIDFLSVMDRVTSMGKSHLVTEHYLLDLIGTHYTPILDVTEHAKILKGYSVKRKLFSHLMLALEELRKEDCNPYDQANQLQKVIDDLSKPTIPQDFSQVLLKYVQTKEALFHGIAQESSISWGIPAWDAVIGKIYPTQFVAVAGSAGAGKSLFLAHAIHKWLEQGIRVGLVSLEMSNSEVLDRLTEIMTGHNPEQVIYAQDKVAWSKITKAWSELYEKPFHISDMVVELEYLQALYHQWKVEADGQPIKILCVDYAGLVTVKNSQKLALFERLSQVSRYLKQFAMKNGVVVVAAVQLNRDGYNTNAPTLRELGGTISFAQDPNVVIGLWRPSAEDHSLLNLKVLKNRSRHAGGVVKMRQDGLGLKILTDKVE